MGVHCSPDSITPSLRMSDKEFQAFSDLVYSICGIKLTPVKQTMLSARLAKRLRARNLHSFKEYYDFLQSQEGRDSELPDMIDAVTTNKTDFLREPKHFDYLTQKVLPDFVKKQRNGACQKSIKIWSAGCSTGQEPYTLAMIVYDYFEKNRGLSPAILATDISTEVLEKAALAVYEHELIAPLALPLRKKYISRSKKRKSTLVRIVPFIRSLVTFKHLNFMSRSYDVAGTFDVIFCRNVLIYFDKTTQEQVIDRLCQQLKTGGHLFLGHSETIHGFNLPLHNLGGTIFEKIQ